MKLKLHPKGLNARPSDDLVGFRKTEAKTLSATTVNHNLKCLRMIFRSALREKAIAAYGFEMGSFRFR
jgi:hypothetical protein